MSRKSAVGSTPEKINVTKTFLPPLEEYEAYLQQIWNSSWLTNQGPLLQEFEKKTKDFLGVDEFHFINNGTTALQVALRALDVTEGEVITTPFSYVATTSAILWEHCTPVYVDIEPNTFCIDPEKIEAAITPNTKAILAVHVFGFPCDIDKIAAIAAKHGLKVIYDGAHGFGATHNGKSLLNYGDISMCSFHATKLFHTIEGGGLIVKDKTVSEKVGFIKNFGHVGDDYRMLGINAKASEFQAAMGLCNFKYIEEILAKRKAVVALYDKYIEERFYRPSLHNDIDQSAAYYPLVFESEEQLLGVLKKLNAQNIFPRRYFYPSLNTLPYVQGESCPVSEDISRRVVCLPLYVDLSEEIVKEIASTINKS